MPQDIQVTRGLRNLTRALAGRPANAGPETEADGSENSALTGVFAVTAADAKPRLNGFRALQPEWVATSDDEERTAWRIPLPRPRTPPVQHVSANGSVDTIRWSEDDFNDAGCKRGAHIDVAARIRQIEETRAWGAGREWAQAKAAFERELSGDYEPRTEVLKQHARELPLVLRRIGRNPKTVLAREERIVAPERVERTSRKSIKWLAGKPGRTIEERAKRGILTEMRITNHNTRENRVVRDFAEMTAREVQRLSQGWSIDAQLIQWGRECTNVAAALREAGVRKLEAGAEPNQVLRMNPDYRRIWTAREQLIQRMDLEDELWSWQAEAWNELGLLAVSVAVMNFESWTPVVKPPVVLRTGQEKGRWLALEQKPFCLLIQPDTGWWMEIQASGVEPNSEAPSGSCCAITLGMIENASKKEAKLAFYVLGTGQGELRYLDRMEELASRNEREEIPYDIGVLTVQERMPQENPRRMSTGGKRHECRVFAERMRPESGLGCVLNSIQKAVDHLQARAGKR